LTDHGLVIPPEATHSQLIDYMKSTYEPIESSLTDKVHKAQSDLVSTWTDSQLRDFLLVQGVIEPSSKREEMELKAREIISELEKGYQSYWHRATETISSDWYAATDAAKTLR
jgi:hypothetical protein